MKRLYIIFVLFTSAIAFGVLGYTFLEGWTFLESLYMTVITLATVGYREVHPLSTAGQVFTIILIIVGLGIFFHAARSFAVFIADGSFRELFIKRARERKMKSMKNHYIICGFHRMGREVAVVLRRRREPFVVVDCEPPPDDWPASGAYVQGSADEEEVLLRAGIKQAIGLISVVGEDAENVFITLTARSVSPKLKITARANTTESVAKLKRAGADVVISPYEICGRRLVDSLMRPTTVDYMETVMTCGGLKFNISEVEVPEDSPLVGKTLSEADPRRQSGAHILAIQRRAGALLSSPGPDDRLEEGDQLVVLATDNQLKTFHRLIGDGR